MTRKAGKNECPVCGKGYIFCDNVGFMVTYIHETEGGNIVDGCSMYIRNDSPRGRIERVG